MQLFSNLKNRKGLLVRLAFVVLVLSTVTVLLSQTVFAMNTYVIKDGDQVKVINTYTTDPAKVLDEAGFALAADDFYTTENLRGETGITVQRAQNITINNCGSIMQTIAYGETVEEHLVRNGISIHGDYKVSVPLTDKTQDDMLISVDHMLSNKETYTVEIPFRTSYVDDPTMELGQEQVITEGTAGQMLCTADVLYVNAEETSRAVLEETVVCQPSDRIIARGTGEAVGAARKPIIGDGFIITTTGEVLTYTHSEKFKATAYSHLDAGCDMVTATGTRVKTGTVAVDPRVIPYGTRMFIITNDGSYVYGLATAEDCGGGVKGNHVDLYFDNRSECFKFGIRSCTIYFLGDVDWNNW